MTSSCNKVSTWEASKPRTILAHYLKPFSTKPPAVKLISITRGWSYYQRNLCQLANELTRWIDPCLKNCNLRYAILFWMILGVGGIWRLIDDFALWGLRQNGRHFTKGIFIYFFALVQNQLYMSTARRRLTPSRSRSDTPTHPTMVTLKSIS